MAEILSNTNRLVEWFADNGLTGWDPYDLKQTKISIFLSGQKGSIGRKVNKLYRGAEERWPLSMRKLMGVRPEVNAKGVGLLLHSCVILQNLTRDERLRPMIELCTDWLLANSNKDFSGRCWGYPFDWQSIVFFPKGTPSSVVTSIVAQAFFVLFKSTGRERYIEVCQDVCRFFLNDLNRTVDEQKKLCFSYTPLDSYQVHNANLMIAQVLVQVGIEIGNSEYVEAGLRCCLFALSEQQKEGFIPYWSLAQTHHTGGMFTDHYHSGFEIRMLHSVALLTGNKRIANAVNRYFDWYDQVMFTEDGLPKTRGVFNSIYPINIHAVAEAILCRSALASELGLEQEKAAKIIAWAEDCLEYSPGEYSYMIKSQALRMDIPMLRWGQGWMLRALSEYELARTKCPNWS